MINEAGKLRIALDIIGDIIAKKTVEIRKCNDENEKNVLKKQLEQMLDIENEIRLGNNYYIDSIIKRGRKKYD